MAYLNALKKYREDNCPIIYEDETYIHGSHTRPKNWADNSASGYMVPVVKGTRLIILHAGGSSGFIPGALRILKSHLKTEDYHGDMNFLNYMM